MTLKKNTMVKDRMGTLLMTLKNKDRIGTRLKKTKQNKNLNKMIGWGTGTLLKTLKKHRMG